MGPAEHGDPRRIVGGARWRVQRAWLEDGLDEVSGGVSGLVMVAVFLAVRQNIFWFFALMPVGLLGMWLQSRVLRGLKARLVDRRAGYVRPRGPDWMSERSGRFWIGFVLGGALFWSVLGSLDTRLRGVTPSEIFGWVAFLFAAMLPLLTAWKTGLWRFALYTAVPLAAVAVALLGGADQMLVLSVWLGAASGLALVLGGAAFRAFLRANPEVAAELNASSDGAGSARGR